MLSDAGLFAWVQVSMSTGAARFIQIETSTCLIETHTTRREFNLSVSSEFCVLRQIEINSELIKNAIQTIADSDLAVAKIVFGEYQIPATGGRI